MIDLDFSKVRILKMTKSCRARLKNSGGRVRFKRAANGLIELFNAESLNLEGFLGLFTSRHVLSVLHRTLIIELSQNPQILEHLL